VPRDAAAVDGHAHAGRGVVGLLGHGCPPEGSGRRPAARGAGAEDAIGSGHNTQHFTDASRPGACVVVNATASARGCRGRRGLIGWPGPVPLPEVPMPAQSSSSPLQTLRTGLWHLRTGGLSQLRTWQRRRRTASYGVGDGTGSLDGAGTLSFPPAKLPDRAPRLAGLRVGVILDDFSMLAWSYECESVAVTPGWWREQLAEAPVDLLLVESAWHGNKDAWQYQLTGSKAPSEPLRELVAHCREQGVPTVFWNKEDPPHFEDFLDTARLFDQVFTTDVTLMPRYREPLGHDRVAVL